MIWFLMGPLGYAMSACSLGRGGWKLGSTTRVRIQSITPVQWSPSKSSRHSSSCESPTLAGILCTLPLIWPEAGNAILGTTKRGHPEAPHLWVVLICILTVMTVILIAFSEYCESFYQIFKPAVGSGKLLNLHGVSEVLGRLDSLEDCLVLTLSLTISRYY